MSALSKLEKLMYTIGITDKASAPVNKIMGKINQLSQQASGAQNQMARGFMGAAGGAMMLVGSLNPAIAANQALGEVSSLGVADSSLQQLNNTAINFSAKYGGNAADVISASYDIQSSIAGLTGEELSAFTNASAVMAKGTKSDAATATNYLGTMFGIYQDDAKALGKNTWVEQLAGQTATAVRMFKTNGNEMSNAFTSLGAGAQSHGIEMAESMAVLGQLQATMSGSEAGTKYKAFLAGVGKAQKALGIELTDAQGKLLPMADVLETIHSKFGNIDTVAKSDALKAAFGSDEATGLIKLLLPQVAQLKGNITALNEETGMQTAIDMANAQTDAWQRLSGGFNAAATSLGQKVLPIIEPVVEVLASMLNGVLWLTEEFPIVTGVIATTVVAITALMVGMGLFNIVMGLSKFGMMGFSATTGILSKSMGGFRSVLNFTKGALIAFQMQSALSGGAFAAIRVGMLGATSSAWAFTAALLANPITWLVGGVILLATVIYKYWQPIKAFMSGFWDGFSESFAPVIAVFSELFSSLSFVGDVFSWVGSLISDVVSWFSALLSPVNSTTEQLQAASNMGVSFGQSLGNALNFIMAPLKAVVNLITKVISSLSWASNAVKEFLGFGSDVDVTANKTTEISGNLSTESVDKVSTLPINNVIPINSAQLAQERIEQSRIHNNEQVRNTTQKVEKSAIAQQFSNSLSNNNKNDNSKRLYIDNVVLQKDTLSVDYEQLMELAS